VIRQLTTSPISEYQHGVTIAVQTVALRNRRTIRAPGALVAGERRDEHEQRRARDVEIREQSAYDAEVESRVNEQIRCAAAWLDRPIVCPPRGLERSRRRRVD